MAVKVHGTKIELCISVALRCRQPEQPPRLGIVFRPTMAGEVHATEAALRLGVPLRCSESE